MTLCSAQKWLLCKKMAELFSEADRDAMEARKISGVCLGFLLSSPRHARRAIVGTERVIIPNSVRKSIHVVRQTKTYLGNLEENSVADLRNID